MIDSPTDPSLPLRPPAGLRAAKLVCVAIYLVAIGGAAVTWWSAAPAARAATALDSVAALLAFVALPAVIAAAALGAAMFARAPGAYLRAHWWQAKAALLATGVPAGIVGLTRCLAPLKAAIESGEGDPDALSRRLSVALALVVAGSCAAVALAVLRPGWGQR